jgi:hypothetical protein
MKKKFSAAEMKDFKNFKINLEHLEITITHKTNPEVKSTLKFEKGMKASPYDKDDVDRIRMGFESALRSVHRTIWENK